MNNFTVINGRLCGANIAEIIASYKFNFSNEKELQEAIAGVLEAESIPFEREVKLSSHDIIDFMIGKVGLEIKVGFSFHDVVSQLHRYAQLDAIDELMLVTTKSQFDMPGEISNKTLTVVNLGYSNSL